LQDAGLISHVARIRHTVQLPDLETLTREDLQHFGELGVAGDLLRCRDQGIQALLVIPMLRGEMLAGVLVVRRRTAGVFPPESVELLETFASQSSVAIQNADLFQQLQQRTRDLEVASKHKSDFMASMSHELRTPLNAVIGFSALLLDPRVNAIPDEQRATFLGHIERSGKHLLGLINDILDLSKVEAGRMELQIERVLLGDLIEGCAATMRVVASSKHIYLESRCEPPDAAIQADPARLKQVLYNLLSNAIKFTPEGGAVRVAARLDVGKAVLTVRDTGIGISSDDQTRVFEEFRQATPSGIRQEQGTGLGLAVVRKLVELHGGIIELESAPGQGSCFTVMLPLKEAEVLPRTATYAESA
jgi:signal transduction histidine kinase